MAMFAYTVPYQFPEPFDASTVAVNKLVVQKDGGFELRGNRQPDQCGQLLPCADRELLHAVLSADGDESLHAQVGVEIHVRVQIAC